MKTLIVCLYFTFALTAQVQAQTPQAEINKHVWEPFVASFNNHQADAFMAVHSKDVVRSARDGKTVWNWDEYKKSQTEGDQEDIKAKRKRTLTLRFTERIASNDLAVEVGVYKTSYLLADGKTMDYYGRFHVVLRKENGTWKILVDTDSSENGTISEKDFLAAKPIN
jgi:ketosteroid isomerase-like protein